MKVLHINSYFVGNKLHEKFAEMQRRHNIDATWYVPTNIPNFLSNENNVIISNCFNNLDRMFFLCKQKKICRDIKEKLNIDEYSIIHAHTVFSNGYVARKLHKETGIPYIVVVRNTDLNVFFKRLIHLRRVGIDILFNASKIIFLSNAYRETLLNGYVPSKYRALLEEKSEIIPNGIDEFWIENKSKHKKDIPTDSLKILTVGAIEKNKNQLMVADVCNLLNKKGIETEYTVAGRINDNSIFEKLSQFSFFNYVGELSKNDLIDVYRKNDIFVLASINESFGLVYAEAMSQGLPVLYTKNQGFDQQFEEGQVGFRIDCSDVQNITEKIFEIMSHYDILASNSVMLVNKFDWNSIVEKYIKIYSYLK